MSIHFDAQAQIFHLRNTACSYIFQITPSGHLAHCYFGAPVRDASAHLLILDRNRSFSPHSEPDVPRFSLDTLPSELPVYGNSDFRPPMVQVQRENGSTISDFRYRVHRIRAGKPPLQGLPATYVEDETEADTLEIDLFDAVTGLVATLSYSVFAEFGVLARSVKLRNDGAETLRVLRCLSASVDFPGADLEWLQLSGAWARERDIHRAPLRPGSQSIESRRGASGHEHNPFFALLAPGTTEDHGEVWAFNLIYSGSFVAQTEVAPYATTRAQIGLNPFDFDWQLAPGESFQAPEAVMVYAARGLGEMSRTFHRFYRQRLCRGAWRDKVRPVLINSWEASYFDISEANIEALGAAAKQLGIELLVMDDGWFGRRDNDQTSLGDWFVHRGKFPDGLAPLATRLNQMGLQFGLWFEPEMVSPDSELYRAHPDWCLHVPDRSRTTSRQQLILDLSRDEVCEALIEKVSAILSTVPIGYVKWDMNRNMTEIGSAALPAARQRETAHRYMLGLYRVLETLTARFPAVLFESCSGGGGRYDPGMLFYMPQTWASDNTDAISRLRIQYGTSLVYPASSLGAHVSASPNHQLGRVTPLATRGIVAMSGTFGYELDLTQLSEADKTEIRHQVEVFKAIRPLIFDGELHRLKSPFEGNETAWMFVSRDQSEAIICLICTLAEPNAPFGLLKLAGLDAARDYLLKEIDVRAIPSSETSVAADPPRAGLKLGGDAWMSAGFRPAETKGDFAARLWHLHAVN